MKPSVARTVHYWENGKEHTAFILKVRTETSVDLHVLKQDGGSAHLMGVELVKEGVGKEGHWSWPERV